MKISDLNSVDQDTFRYLLRGSNGCVPKDVLPLSKNNYLLLRQQGYVIDHEQEVLRLDMSGKLRQCANGLPCRHYCGGLDSGKCSQRKFPTCGVADGACLATKQPCNSHCEQKKQIGDQFLFNF